MSMRFCFLITTIIRYFSLKNKSKNKRINWFDVDRLSVVCIVNYLKIEDKSSFDSVEFDRENILSGVDVFHLK